MRAVLLCALVLLAAHASSALSINRATLKRQVGGTRCGTLHCPFDNGVCCPGDQVRKPTCCPTGYACDLSGQTTLCQVAGSQTLAQQGSISASISPQVVLGSGQQQQAAAQGSAPGSFGGQQASAAVQGSLGQAMSNQAPGSMGQTAGSVAAADPSNPAAQGSAPGSDASASESGAPDATAAAGGAEGGAGGKGAPKYRQNIIIVKNINVLTKLQQSPKIVGGGFGGKQGQQRARQQQRQRQQDESSEESSESGSEESSESSEESSEESGQSQ